MRRWRHKAARASLFADESTVIGFGQSSTINYCKCTSNKPLYKMGYMSSEAHGRRVGFKASHRARSRHRLLSKLGPKGRSGQLAGQDTAEESGCLTRLKACRRWKSGADERMKRGPLVCRQGPQSGKILEALRRNEEMRSGRRDGLVDHGGAQA